MLSDHTLVAFLATADPARARRFYEGVLGLKFTSDNEHLMTFQSGVARVSLQKADRVEPKFGTAMGWDVPDIHAEIRALRAKGAVFERYDAMEQDELGVWQPIPGHGVAWFKDPDGNLLSLSGPAG